MEQTSETFQKLKTVSPEKNDKTLMRIKSRVSGVSELDCDNLLLSLQGQETREEFWKSYIEYLDKTTNNTWRKRKQVLFSYPGITEDWHLFDPYNAVISHLNRPDNDLNTTSKDKYQVGLIFPRASEKESSVRSQAGVDYLGFEELYQSLNDAGYQAQIHNAEQSGRGIDSIVDEVVKSGLRVIGINLTARTARNGLELAKKLKQQDPSIYIVLGGRHMSVSAQEEDIFTMEEFENIDAVIIGKGNLTFPLLVDALRRGESLKNIPDIIYREDNDRSRIKNAWRVVPLSKYPMIPHVQLANSPASRKIKSARMSTSEGCFGQCSYCMTRGLYEGHYSPRSIKQIVDEIEFLQKKYGTNLIYFNDDLFIKAGNDGFRRAKEFCDELERRNIHIKFRPLLRPDSIPFTPEGDALFQRLKNNGMEMLFVGFESASEHMLEIMDKHVDPENYMKFIGRARREGVALQLGFITWHPLMTVEDAKQNFTFLSENQELYTFSILTQKLDIFPGTRDKKKLQEMGLLSSGFNCLSDPQNYEFQDRFVGKLADRMSRLHQDDRSGRFDRAICRLRLTVIPELLDRAKKILQTNSTPELRQAVNNFDHTYSEAMTKINSLFSDFIQNYLKLYGENKTVLDRFLSNNSERLYQELVEQLRILGKATVTLKKLLT